MEPSSINSSQSEQSSSDYDSYDALGIRQTPLSPKSGSRGSREDFIDDFGYQAIPRFVDENAKDERGILDLRNTVHAAFHEQYSTIATIHRGEGFPIVELDNGKTVQLEGFISPMPTYLADALKLVEKEGKTLNWTFKPFRKHPWLLGLVIAGSILAVAGIIGGIIAASDFPESEAFDIANSTYFPDGDLAVEQAEDVITTLMYWIITSVIISITVTLVATDATLTTFFSRQSPVRYVRLRNSHDDEEEHDEESPLLECKVHTFACGKSNVPYLEVEGEYFLLRLQDNLMSRPAPNTDRNYLKCRPTRKRSHSPTLWVSDFESAPINEHKVLRRAAVKLRNAVQSIEIETLAQPTGVAKQPKRTDGQQVNVSSVLAAIEGLLHPENVAHGRSQQDDIDLLAAANDVSRAMADLLQVVPSETSNERPTLAALQAASQQFSNEMLATAHLINGSQSQLSTSDSPPLTRRCRQRPEGAVDMFSTSVITGTAATGSDRGRDTLRRLDDLKSNLPTREETVRELRQDAETVNEIIDGLIAGQASEQSENEATAVRLTPTKKLNFSSGSD